LLRHSFAWVRGRLDRMVFLNLLAKLHSTSTAIKLNVWFTNSSASLPDPGKPWNPPSANRTYEQCGGSAVDSAQSPSLTHHIFIKTAHRTGRSQLG